MNVEFTPPSFLKNGLAMTLYVAFRAKNNWEQSISDPEPSYQEMIFIGGQEVPIYGKMVIPPQAKGTVIGTYGITGELDNQWLLKLLGRKAFARNYAVILFDWRAHGKTAELSPTLTSDGLYEGQDFVKIAAQAKQIGCPAPFWFTGYSLGGQLALWGIKEAQTIDRESEDLGLKSSDIAGGAVICPSLDSNRSLSYLVRDKWGRYLEKSIAKQLKKLALRIYNAHPQAIDPEAIKRANTIEGFDRELVISHLGFSSVQDYYNASSPLPFLAHLKKPTFIIYAADDPMFDPTIISDLQIANTQNSHLDLMLTRYGGHVGYISRSSCQNQYNDPDCWWALNRVVEWFELF